MTEFKHNDMCWYFGRLNHQGKPYGWPCCGEISDCDSEYVEALKKENARIEDALSRSDEFYNLEHKKLSAVISTLREQNERMKSALERLSIACGGFCCDCPDIREFAQSALMEVKPA